MRFNARPPAPSDHRVSAYNESHIRPTECWCCGVIQPPDRMVHLGNHSEVHLCIRCAYSVKNWARELEDQDKTGLGVKARDAFRRARQSVIRRQLHRIGWVGRPVRWLGRRLP
jgi:hypothetical protein